MTRAKYPKARLDEKRYPIRVRLAVPNNGFGAQYWPLAGYLDGVCGKDGWSLSASGLGTYPTDTVYLYLNDATVVRPLLKRFGLDTVEVMVTLADARGDLIIHREGVPFDAGEEDNDVCGRYATANLSWEQYREWLDIGGQADDLVPPSWNVKPTQDAPIVRLGEDGGRILSIARWWLVPRFFTKSLKEWKASTFNARLETAPKANSFHLSWKDRRCLVPAIGWYEWTGPKGDRTPNYFSIETNAPGLCFAGLWDRAHTANGKIDSFTILTTEPNEVAREYHSRMPVVLEPDSYDEWLNADVSEPAQIAAERLKVHRVAPLRGDGPELIEPA